MTKPFYKNCPDCNEPFSRSAYFYHTAKSAETGKCKPQVVKPYTCHVCDKDYKTKETYKTHMRKFHNIKDCQEVYDKEVAKLNKCAKCGDTIIKKKYGRPCKLCASCKK